MFGYGVGTCPGIGNCYVCDKVGILHACCSNILPDLGADPSSYVVGFGSFLGRVYDVVVRVGDGLMKCFGNE